MIKKDSFRVMVATAIILIAFTALSTSVSGQVSTFSLGFQAGQSYVNGYYADQLNTGIFLSIYGLYSYNNFLFAENDLSYSNYSLKESKASDLTQYSFFVGPLFLYPAKYIKPYMGLLAGINMINLQTVATNNNEKTYKPGITARAGFFIRVFENISFRIGSEYSINELSEELFKNIKYSAGLSYSFNATADENAEFRKDQIIIDNLYEEGLKYFEAGNGEKAKEFFQKVHSHNANHKKVQYYLEFISVKEVSFNKALSLIKEEKNIDALPLLIESGKYILAAQKKLQDTRALLVKQEKDFEKKGIQSYENKDYEKCIFYMKKVQMINPDNENAGIYLPRAEKRNSALKILE